MIAFDKIQKSMETSFRKLSTTPIGGHGNLHGKVAVVTASTQGIGYAIAKRFAQEGARVMISSRRENNVKEAMNKLAAEKLFVSGTVCHVGKDEDRKRLFEEVKSEFGGLDILVSNAAANPTFGPMFETSAEAWDKIFDINVKCSFLLMKDALPLLRNSKHPSVVLISSIAGFQPMEMLGAYSVSKTALLGLCKAAASELAVDNIRVNCIAPGLIRTKFSSTITQSEAATELIMDKVLIKRIGEPEEIAGAAAYLASNDSSYMTGETIAITGGMLSRL